MVGYRPKFRPAPTRVLASPALISGLLGLAIAFAVWQKVQAAEVTTYHYNMERTGWNERETTLTPSAVKAGSFGQLRSVALDEQVDAQPLIMSDMSVSGQPQDVVYVVTENDTVYAIDASEGVVLQKRKLGAPVSTGKSGVINCGNNSSVIGITSTPVIDRTSKTLYLVAFLAEGGQPVYRIFALDLATLADKIPSQVINASAKLNDGSTISLIPTVTRQRAALALANGNVYAAFGSFCDHDANITRGWLLGWQANTLTALKRSQLNDHRDHTVKNYYLSSIWMSGYGPAVDESGNIYFITGNSLPDKPGSAPTIDPKLNLQESLVKVTANLDEVLDYFTPANMPFLDTTDNDFGSGGALVIPGDQPGSPKRLAIAAGKLGTMFLIDRNNLGKFNPSGPNRVLAAVDIGRCWCGQSYFVGWDGVGRVLSSGNNTLSSWKIQTSPTTTLTKEWDTKEPLGNNVFQKGFFTSVSSNGETQETAVVWAVQRPATEPPVLTLWAFNAKDGSKLVEAPAGSWPNKGGAANTVPVVANGRVYVASYKELRIFGLGAPPPAAFAAMDAPARMRLNATVYGTVIEVDGPITFLRTRTTVIRVDTTDAERNYKSVTLVPGKAVSVNGQLGPGEVMKGESIEYAPDSPALWGRDE
jgi:hypothetical protein